MAVKDDEKKPVVAPVVPLTRDQQLRAMNAKSQGVAQTPTNMYASATPSLMARSVAEGAPIALDAVRNVIKNSYTGQYVADPTQKARAALKEGRYLDYAGQALRGLGAAGVGMISDIGQPFVNYGKMGVNAVKTAFTGDNTQPSPSVIKPEAPALPPGWSSARAQAIADGNIPPGSVQAPTTAPAPTTSVAPKFATYTPGSQVDLNKVPAVPAGTKVIATGNSTEPNRLAAPASFRLEGGRPGQLAEMSSDDPAGAVKIENMAKSLQERGVNSIADLEKYTAAPSGPPGLNAQEIIASNEARKERARRAEAYNMAKLEFASAGTDRPEARREALRTMAQLSGTDPGKVKGKTALNPLEESQRLENEANAAKLTAANRAEGIALASKAFAGAGGVNAELFSSVVDNLSSAYGIEPSTVSRIMMEPILKSDAQAQAAGGELAPDAFSKLMQDGADRIAKLQAERQQR